MVIFSVETNNNLWFRERKQITTTSKDAFASHYASGIISIFVYLIICYLYIISEIKNIQHDGYHINMFM